MRQAIFLAILLSEPALLFCQEKKASEQKLPLPDGKGKEITQTLCGKCHGAQIVLGKPHSEEGWGAIVADMVQRGAQGTDDELYEVVQYLTKNIKASINVNKATAKDLESGLEIPAKDAEAIVHAREKGEFKSFDDVMKVPGIDTAKLEAKKSRLVF